MKKDNNAFVWCICSLVVCAVCIGSLAYIHKMGNDYSAKLVEYSNYLSDKYRERYEFDFDTNTAYSLISLDKGKHWYEVKNGKILGDFNIRHKGLLAKMQKRSKAFIRLSNYVEQHGPIGSSGNITKEEEKILNDISIYVVRKNENY